MEINNEPKVNIFGKFAPTAILVWEFLKIVLIALIIIIPIRYFIFQPFIVSGASMEPNFYNAQYLIIDELTYHFKEPQRGEVVVLIHHFQTNERRSDGKEFYIKRVIGLPGEKIQIDNGRVTIINDQHPEGITLDEPYLPNQGITYPHDPKIVGGKKTITLSSDEYFMMGDNRLASSDSRDWGPLKRADMVGRVLLRALPITSFQLYTKSPVYSP
ncbi:MAG: signal peptidase I [Candidatus Doudnabacteria bacterium RIFCSPLOWO2_01_FULL_44_21]|uniref:Signal peptidase I n=1 Tax=Candidatus Doudnabacteria bacterium RIFCSPLOWO2_01_FULL_44_21 TaxID=1817841 RepID=A0A1F5Q2J3_9BACT|nr:MAG: signal peptidase I [Candidatus Doudnabacteria bacterium RIFCSPHIGHO2_02_FULL_43_13b]OGE96401.1 MAG: signal peptidase I [Candidatus Doudnabacteria bacterium RIFCSPLOWO2_01_FULL_44_21]